jgi:hypothetical protein
MYVAKYGLLCDGKQVGIADTRREAQCKVLAMAERSATSKRIRVVSLKKRAR